MINEMHKLFHVDSWYNPRKRLITVLVFSAVQKIIVVDLPPILLDCRRRELIDSGMKLWFYRKHLSHNLFVSLRQQTASTVKHRGDFCFSCVVIIQKSPVSVVTIEIS